MITIKNKNDIKLFINSLNNIIHADINNNVALIRVNLININNIKITCYDSMYLIYNNIITIKTYANIIADINKANSGNQ